MLRSITRSQAITGQTEQTEKEVSKKVQAKRVRSDKALRDHDVDTMSGAEVDASSEAELEAEEGVLDDSTAQTEYDSEPEYQQRHDEAEEQDDDEVEMDVETLEGSGPGQFLIRRNAELLAALYGLRGEVEAMRRIVENGNDTAADRIVRAIDRTTTATTDSTRHVHKLLVLLALLNLALIGLVVHIFWPFSFLPVAAL